MEKEQNFVSAVVYIRNNSGAVKPFFSSLQRELDAHFEKYELIAVNAACTDNSCNELAEWGAEHSLPITVIHMSSLQSREACMNAGLDISIGDFVYEFDYVEGMFPWETLFHAYEMMLKGNDIVSVCPSQMGGGSSLFYRLFNAYSNSPYEIRTNAFCLVSRRALHRVHAISAYMPYRKAAYASSGLKNAVLEYSGRCYDKHENRLRLAVESLLLYTHFGYRVSILLSIAMAFVTMSACIYVIAVYCLGSPIAGWTTTSLMISFGFTGVFLGNTIVVKYLALLLELLSKRERYLVENVEKIQK